MGAFEDHSIQIVEGSQYGDWIAHRSKLFKALEPEVLPSKDGGHFAFRTPLGWCVDGLLTKIGKESSIPCTQIVVQDAATGKIASHHFGISSKAKDINSKQMLENIYNTEFCESRLGFGIEVSNNMEDFSFEDQKTLKLMDEKSRKVGKHFEYICH